MSVQKQIKVLLVDDESSVLTALKLLLEAMKFAVSDFVRATDAIELLNTSEQQFDLVLCDLKMPEVNGLDALKRIKQLRPELPFVLMSAHASQTEIGMALKNGARGFLAKPFTPTQLLAQIEKSIAENQRES